MREVNEKRLGRKQEKKLYSIASDKRCLCNLVAGKCVLAAVLELQSDFCLCKTDIILRICG